MTAPKILTSKPDFQSFSNKAIETLLADTVQRNDSPVRFLEEIHFWSQNLKGWTGDITAATFWTEKLPSHIPDAEHFFCFYWRGNSIAVTGLPKFDPVISAVIVNETNTLIYSRAQHDYFEHGGVAVDGGRDCQRIVGDPTAYTKCDFNMLTRQYRTLPKGRWKDVS